MEQKILKFSLSPKDLKIKKVLNKEFLELEIYAISTINPNKNNSHFTEESLEASKDTCYNKPILGCYNTIKNDFEEHNSDTRYDSEFKQEYFDYTEQNTEKILGLIRESDNIDIVQGEDEIKWLKITCALWTYYSYRQVKRLLKSNSKKVSVEVIPVETHEKDGILHIDKFILSGITILGDHMSEGIPDAHLNIVEMMNKFSFKKQAECLSFAYNMNSKSDKNDEDLYKNNNLEGKILLTYMQKREMLNSALSRIENDFVKNCFICDFSDADCFVRNYVEDKVYRIPYTSSEDFKEITFDLDNKVAQMSAFVDFVAQDKTVEIDGEQKNVEEMLAMYSEVKDVYENYKSEIDTKVFSITIEDTEYDIQGLQDKYSADIQNLNEKLEESKTKLEASETDLTTMTANFNDMSDKFNSVSNELTTLKAQIEEEKKQELCDQGCTMAETEESLDDKEKETIKNNCKSNKYSSIEEVEDEIAKIVYKKFKANKSDPYFSNIVHPKAQENEQLGTFEKLKNYSNN